MSASMFHLAFAREIAPDAPDEFFVGSLAPDCIVVRRVKDHTHLRDALSREAALRALRDATPPEDAYGMGILGHLYYDWLWDTAVRALFKRLGVRRYRQEISDASVWWYHHADWSAELWRRIVACPVTRYLGHGLPAGLVCDYVSENRLWHMRSDCAPSGVFPPEDCAAFTEKAAEQWRRFAARTE